MRFSWAKELLFGAHKYDPNLPRPPRENGTGAPPNPVKAFEWYLKSAEQGFPAAQLSLGVMYSDGKGVQRDLVKAYMWVAVAGSGKAPGRAGRS